MPSIPNAVLVWQQARPPRCPGSSQLSWVFKMRAMNQLMNILVFPVSGLQTPGILQDMATMHVQSKRDKQHHWQLQQSAWKTGKGILCHSCCESSIMQPSCIQSWIWVKPELSSYRH